MASSYCFRSVTRSSTLSTSIKSHFSKFTKIPPPFFKSSSPVSSSTSRRFASVSRLPVELGCGSLFPLHSAVAEARMTSRLSTASCRDISQGTLCRTYPGL